MHIYEQFSEGRHFLYANPPGTRWRNFSFVLMYEPSACALARLQSVSPLHVPWHAYKVSAPYMSPRHAYKVSAPYMCPGKPTKCQPLTCTLACLQSVSPLHVPWHAYKVSAPYMCPRHAYKVSAPYMCPGMPTKCQPLTCTPGMPTKCQPLTCALACLQSVSQLHVPWHAYKVSVPYMCPGMPTKCQPLTCDPGIPTKCQPLTCALACLQSVSPLQVPWYAYKVSAPYMYPGMPTKCQPLTCALACLQSVSPLHVPLACLQSVSPLHVSWHAYKVSAPYMCPGMPTKCQPLTCALACLQSVIPLHARLMEIRGNRQASWQAGIQAYMLTYILILCTNVNICCMIDM